MALKQEYMLFNIKNLNDDIKYFHSLINNMHDRVDLRSISGSPGYISLHNRCSYYYTINSFHRIITNLKNRRRSLYQRLRSVS